MDPALRELLAEGNPTEEIEAILRLTPGATELPAEATEIARFAEIVTVRIQRQAIETVWTHPSVQSLKAPRALQFDEPSDDGLGEWFSGTSARRSFGNQGKGVVVGVIDWGFDFAHPAFLDRSGKSRVLALWDQRGHGPNPPRFGYGTVHTQDAINAALGHERPYQVLGYHPGDSDRGMGAHGTHVADVAAGTIRPNGGGMAPLADLVFVHLASAPLTGLASLGDSVRLLEALKFIEEIADGRPFVVNMSIGRHGGPHTGLTLVEQAIDRFLETGPNRLVVQSAGNYYTAKSHASGRILPGGRDDLTWITRATDKTPNELEIWYSNRDVFRLELTPPNAKTPITVELGGARGIFQPDGREAARIYHRAYDPNTPDHHIEVFLKPDAPAGEWKLSFIGDTVEDGRWHAWIERDSGNPKFRTTFKTDQIDPSGTIGSICNGFLPIAVGAMQQTAAGPRPAAFASAGPTRDGRQKPDLCAPGYRIRAARSTPRWSHRPRPGSTTMSGASQASPYVCGIAACYLSNSHAPQSIHAIRAGIMSMVTPAASLAPHSEQRMGAGFISPPFFSRKDNL